MAAASPAPNGAEERHKTSTPFHDRAAQAVLARYNQLPGRGKPQGRSWTVLAGILAEKPGGLQVLALATGTRCIGVAAMTAGEGQVVHDCHAEALCRRAFHRFLLADMIRAAKGPEAAGTLLKRVSSQELLFAVQEQVHLHFYVSTLPCGQCTLLPLNNSGEGSLARKLRERAEEAQPAPVYDRNRTGAKPSRGMPADPRADGAHFHRDGVLRYKSGRSDTRPESRTVCYSCSDKICRWNHIGWQGAWLSRLMQAPLYMQSVIIGGSLFDKGFVENALFGRAAGAGTSAPSPCFCHTGVSFQSSREEAEAVDMACKVSTAGLSVVWAAADLPGDLGSRLQARSISGKIEGFYDILIGHTGQRQGLRNDHGRRNDQAGPHSWVSPLSKKLMARDTLLCICHVLESQGAFANWLASSQAEGAQAPEDVEDAPAAKRRRLAQDSQAAERSCEEGAVLLRYPSYAWFKEALSCAAYRSLRNLFHSGDPFVHWPRKQSLTFLKEERAVDAFEVDTATLALTPPGPASDLVLAQWPMEGEAGDKVCGSQIGDSSK